MLRRGLGLALLLVSASALPAHAQSTAAISLRLHEAVVTACPAVVGISIGTMGDASSVIVSPASQQACAQATINAFDWSASAQTGYENLRARTLAKAQWASPSELGKTLRCFAQTTLSEINNLRAAYPLPVTSITRSGTTATATTRWAHGLANGAQVVIHGADVAAYNGTVTIAGASGSTFTYTVAGTPTTPAAGSLLAFPVTAALAPRTLAQLRSAIDACVDAGTQD